ncbi:hypothetical protein MUK42_07118, partial [Musa troglodytarum]
PPTPQPPPPSRGATAGPTPTLLRRTVAGHAGTLGARPRPFGVPTTPNPTVGSDRCAPRDSRSTWRTKSEGWLRGPPETGDLLLLVAIARGLLRVYLMATGCLGFPTPFAFWLRETGSPTRILRLDGPDHLTANGARTDLGSPPSQRPSHFCARSVIGSN